MRKNENNFAYIDGANLHKSIANLGWKLDYKRFRVWLTEKYGVTKAYLFIGMLPRYTDLYTRLQDAGYTLVFREVSYDRDGKAKGNCDADLVVRCMQDLYEHAFDRAILVTSDGDYVSLLRFLADKDKLHTILSPSMENRCSILIKRTGASIVYINDRRSNLEYKSIAA
ncbi:MAG TPA: NYN domain-containing protein [Bacteroidia bacterium]|nr:NYN domain-containing protein [Bacteroidia bacterium]